LSLGGNVISQLQFEPFLSSWHTFETVVHGRDNIFVEAMLILNNTVMCIRVEAGKALDVTGHYPVLAGYDSTGEPLYIAAKYDLKQSGCVFTYVNNGASHATFMNKNGDAETVNYFYVLVLRHDPVDSKPTGVPEGAMDPTGPCLLA